MYIIESCIGNEASNDESTTGAKIYLVLNTLLLVLLNFYSFLNFCKQAICWLLHLYCRIVLYKLYA